MFKFQRFPLAKKQKIISDGFYLEASDTGEEIIIAFDMKSDNGVMLRNLYFKLTNERK